MKYTFLDFAEEVFKAEKVPLSVNDIWRIGCEKGCDKKFSNLGKTPWSTLGARLYVDIRDNENSRFQQVSNRPALFSLRELTFDSKAVLEAVEKSEIEEASKKSDFSEADLHPLLAKFVSGNRHFRCITKTINHSKSRKGQIKEEWRYPDMVGATLSFDDFRETGAFLSKLGNTMSKVFSFELKKHINGSNVRNFYFQAVSNCSWANEGYLVAIIVTDEAIDEIAKLNKTFGIGLIRLNADNIEESEILFFSRGVENLDLYAVEALGLNPDAKEFFDEIADSIQLRKVSIRSRDKILSDDEMRKFIQDKKMSVK